MPAPAILAERDRVLAAVAALDPLGQFRIAVLGEPAPRGEVN
jgi:hypothetical protein